MQFHGNCLTVSCRPDCDRCGSELVSVPNECEKTILSMGSLHLVRRWQEPILVCPSCPAGPEAKP